MRASRVEDSARGTNMSYALSPNRPVAPSGEWTQHHSLVPHTTPTVAKIPKILIPRRKAKTRYRRRVQQTTWPRRKEFAQYCCIRRVSGVSGGPFYCNNNNWDFWLRLRYSWPLSIYLESHTCRSKLGGAAAGTYKGNVTTPTAMIDSECLSISSS
jgi:hypothetical protein